MNTKMTQQVMQKLYRVVAVVSLLFLLTSCARKITFLTSSVVPAAEGSVKVSKDNNKNYNIKIALSNLAEPNRLQPAKSMYVVWMESDAKPIQNIGQIKTSNGLFGGKNKSSYETVSTNKPTRIIITAEDDANVQFPGYQVVLSTDTF